MKSRNFSRVAASVVAALAAGSALALDQNGTNAAQVQLVAGGSSAARDAFLIVMSQELCASGLTVYKSASADFRAYSCTLIANDSTIHNPLTIGNILFQNGQIGGKTATLWYRSEGGSVWGPLSIVARKLNAGFAGIKGLDTTAAGCAAVAVSTNYTIGSYSQNIDTVICTGAGAGYSLDTDAATPGLVDKQTQLGVSDVESRMFTGANYPTSAKFPAETSAISTELKNLSNSSGFGQTFGVLVNTTNPLTNLTQAQVSAILSANYTDWSQVGWAAGGPITVVRREPGSGTQASAAAVFLHQNCGDSLTFVDSTDGVTQQFSTTGGLVGYVAGHSNAVAISGYAEGGSGNPANTRFVTINGVSGNRTNVQNGTYIDAFELTTQKSPVGAVLSGTSLNFANAMQSILKRVTTTPDVPNVFAIPSATNLAGSSSGSRVVAQGTRNGNSCLPFQAQ